MVIIPYPDIHPETFSLRTKCFTITRLATGVESTTLLEAPILIASTA